MEIEPFETKKERCRTRWTASLDRVFVDLVVEQIQLGNRPNNIFDKKTWSKIRNKFIEQTGLQFNNNQLRKHYDVLRIRYNNIKSSIDQNNNNISNNFPPPIEESCSAGFDLWDTLAVQARPEPVVKVKECHIFDQLTVMFADSGEEGKYAQSSHYGGGLLLDNNNPNPNPNPLCIESGTPHSDHGPSSSRSPEENATSADGFDKRIGMTTVNNNNRKRKRGNDAPPSITIEKEEELKNAMAEALSEMIDASNLTVAGCESVIGDGYYSIAKCLKALDEIEGIHQSIYFDAVDMFETTPGLREMFMSLNCLESRALWLHEKCGRNVFMF